MRGPAARAAAALLLALLAPGLSPYSAAAQVVGVRAVPAPVSGVPTVVAPLTSVSLAPSLTLSPLSAPSALAVSAAAPAPAAAAAAAAPTAPAAAAPALQAAAAQVAHDAPALGRIPTEQASASGETQFRLLIGETFAEPSAVAAADGPSAPAPSGLTPAPKPSAPLDPVRRRGVRTMIAGTSAMKLGMETVTLSVPLLVLSGLGGASTVAALLVGYGIAQAVFSGAVGGLMERWAPQKVLAGAVAAQALVVGSIVALGATGLLSLSVLAVSYILVGGAVGIMETARQSLPARILGHDEDALSRYNARLHIFYEISGVIGPLAAGALMASFGPLWALVIQPPAYLAAAWLFSRVRLPDAPKASLAPKPSLGRSLSTRIKDYVTDVRQGARLVLGDGRLRWVALAFVLPQILHRLLEGLIVPVFAKRVLSSAGDAAYMLTASNLGELVGAFLLLKLAAKIPAPAWVKRGALALLAASVLAFTHSLWPALAVIFAMSATWSSSDLSLRSDIQARLGERDLPRATSFLFGAFVLGASAASFALGYLFDALAPGSSFGIVAALWAVVGAAVWFAARHFDSRRSSDSISSSKR